MNFKIIKNITLKREDIINNKFLRATSSGLIDISIPLVVNFNQKMERGFNIDIKKTSSGIKPASKQNQFSIDLKNKSVLLNDIAPTSPHCLKIIYSPKNYEVYKYKNSNDYIQFDYQNEGGVRWLIYFPLDYVKDNLKTEENLDGIFEECVINKKSEC